MGSVAIDFMNVLMFVVVPIAIIYANNLRKDREFRITTPSSKPNRLDNAKCRLFDHHILREQPFFSGTLAGMLFGVKLAFCALILLGVGLAEEWIFDKTGTIGGIIFFVGFLSQPWPAFLDPTLDIRLIVAIGIGINIGLLGLARGIYEAIESKI